MRTHHIRCTLQRYARRQECRRPLIHWQPLVLCHSSLAHRYSMSFCHQHCHHHHNHDRHSYHYQLEDPDGFHHDHQLHVLSILCVYNTIGCDASVRLAFKFALRHF